MGEVSLDSSVLISKNIFKLFDYGIFRYSTIHIPPSVYADLKYTNKIKTKEKLIFSIEEFIKICEKQNIPFIINDKIPKWMEDEVQNFHPSLISSIIDTSFIKWIRQNDLTAVIGDRGNIGDVKEGIQTIWLLPNSEISLSSWTSMVELFEFLKRSVGNINIKFSINEMKGIPICYGTLDLKEWKCEFNINY